MSEKPKAAEPENLAMIEKRRIEAEILKHVYDTLVASHGEAAAQAAVAEAVRRSAIEQARRFAVETHDVAQHAPEARRE